MEDKTTKVMTCDKIQYDTYQEAMSAAHGVSKSDGFSMTSYKCKECGKYHLATKGKKKRIKNIYGDGWDKVKIKLKKPRGISSKPIRHPPESTYKMLSKEQSNNFKKLIEDQNKIS